MNKTKNKIIVYIILIAMTFLMIFPFLWMVSSSLKTQAEIFSFPPSIFPKTLKLDNFKILFIEYNFLTSLVNSIYIAILGTIGSLFFCSLAGYGFSKYEFKGKVFLFGLVLGSLMIPLEVIMVPLFQVYIKLNWIDSHIGLIVPGLANAYGIFYMTQFFKGINKEIIESGRIDGAGEFRIFIGLIAPLLKPAYASLGIIFFMNSWNNFLWPLIILKSPEMLTIAVAIKALQQGLRTPYNLIMAGSVVSIVPLLVAFLFLQKNFIEGLSAGAVKG